MPDIQKNFENRMPQNSYPYQPQEVLGVDTKALLRLGEVASTMHFLPPSISTHVSKLPDITRVAPLVEQIHSGKPLTREDVEPYKEAIIRLNPSLGSSSNIETDFQRQTATALEAARKKINELELEENLKMLASFDNPRGQFIDELRGVAQRAYESVEEQRSTRIARTATKKEVVTAYDAGAGINETLRFLISENPRVKQQYPILSSILSKIPVEKLPSPKKLALLAPEILEFLFSVVPHDARYASMLKSVQEQPHRLRFLTPLVRKVTPVDIRKAQFWAKNLLPAVRDVLPTDGSKLRDGFARAIRLLGASGEIPLTAEQQKAFAKGSPIYFAGGFMHDTQRNQAVVEHIKGLGYDTVSPLPNVNTTNSDTNFTVTVTGGKRPVTLSRKNASYVTHKPYIETSISTFQQARASELIKSLEATGGKINAVFQSADALNGLLAASERPDLFNAIILAYPAGLARQPSTLRSAPRVLRGAMTTTLHKLRTPEGESFERKVSKEVKSIRRRDSGGFTTAASVAMSSQSKLLHELKGTESAPRVALVLGARDYMMAPERILASLQSSNDVDEILVVDTPHGINGDKKVINEILELFPRLKQDRKLQRNIRGEALPLADRITFSASVSQKERAQILRVVAELDAKS